ncbi:hypothetical protein CLHOM_19410 [Clostridium homopropionicum DSM 5847]|uniref:DUF3829 domain-containing protein n=1 Tax=Clostridium homopropionicum DSM 5847 TaxID=1121318 RepID=A0A0L6ZA64_9CLOT|nr:hypothetical protein [Clostridium homopropionicum]KOA19852.1 hypothetical protein CLHOM_19410 [Clostridium homopropionicum DSM 5847]SFF76043.1 hypothetical protein SAMN04488501_10251 [Clostridium homopropionicum]
MIKQEKKRTRTVIIAISAILLGLLVFFGTYYFFMNKSYSHYTDKVKTEITNITKINEASSTFTKGETIDKDKILNSIPNSISSLQTSLSNLKNLLVQDKYKKDHENLINGVENNISIYKQILAICRDSNNSNLQSYITLLQKYRDDCMNYYTLVSINNYKISLTDEIIDLIDKTIDFSQKQVRLNLDKEVSTNQNRDFLNILNPLVEKFNEVNKDYMPEILNIRNNSTSYEGILDSITNAEAVIADSKTTLAAVTIPKDALEVNKAFIKTLDDFDQYIQSFKFAVKTESLTYSGGVNNNKALDSLYSSSKDKMKTANESYKVFLKLFHEFKDKLPVQ